jgi:hypothetical protein
MTEIQTRKPAAKGTSAFATGCASTGRALYQALAISSGRAALDCVALPVLQEPVRPRTVRLVRHSQISAW